MNGFPVTSAVETKSGSDLIKQYLIYYLFEKLTVSDFKKEKSWQADKLILIQSLWKKILMFLEITENI